MNYRVTIHFVAVEAVSPEAAAEQIYQEIYTNDDLEARLIMRVAPEYEPGPMPDEIAFAVEDCKAIRI